MQIRLGESGWAAGRRERALPAAGRAAHPRRRIPEGRLARVLAGTLPET
ncbi:hypothetical protein [Pseudonocardia sp.]